MAKEPDAVNESTVAPGVFELSSVLLCLDDRPMGSRTVTTLFDDLDESTEQVRTVELSFDGRSVEIDLGTKNYDKLAKAITPYLDAGRRATASRRRRTSTSPAKGSSTTANVRAWAEANGYAVSSRGRIPAEILNAYNAGN